MSVRFKESGTWGSWSGITAEALTVGNKTISGTLNTSGTITCPSIATTVGSTGLYIQNGGNCIVSGKISIANLFPMAMLQ